MQKTVSLCFFQFKVSSQRKLFYCTLPKNRTAGIVKLNLLQVEVAGSFLSIAGISDCPIILCSNYEHLLHLGPFFVSAFVSNLFVFQNKTPKELLDSISSYILLERLHHNCIAYDHVFLCDHFHDKTFCSSESVS